MVSIPEAEAVRPCPGPPRPEHGRHPGPGLPGRTRRAGRGPLRQTCPSRPHPGGAGGGGTVARRPHRAWSSDPSEAITGLHGITVVTQPHFVAERGEQYATEVPAEELPDLWRLRTLVDAGLAVAAGSDAPFGEADPWHIMRTAIRRPWNLAPSEALGPPQALCLFLGGAGAPARPQLITPPPPPPSRPGLA